MNTHRLLLSALTLGLAACSTSSSTSYTGTSPTGPGGGPTADAFVGIADYAFTPESISIAAGKTVEWTNNGPSTHTVTSNSSAWSSQTLAPPSGMDPYGGPTGGGSFTFTFTTPGTYAYHCSIHAGMVGVVVVTP